MSTESNKKIENKDLYNQCIAIILSVNFPLKVEEEKKHKRVKWTYQRTYVMLLMRVGCFSRERVEETATSSFLLCRMRVLIGNPISIKKLEDLELKIPRQRGCGCSRNC